MLLAVLLLISRLSQAQVDNYQFAASAGTFTPLPATATAVSDILDDDAVSAALPIGFTFVYDGSPYTSFYVSSNGFLSFNSSADSNLTNDLAGGDATERPLIAPLWDDLGGQGPTCKASYQLTGTAPNRVLTFEWLDWEWRYTASGPVLSFQVKLYETSNRVELVYRQEANAPASPSASIGLAGVGSGSGSFLSVSDAIATPTVSSTTSSDNITQRPPTGQVYAFTPPVPSACPTPRNFSVAATNTTANLSWTVAGGTGPFTVLYGPTGFNPALPSSATNQYTTLTGLTATTLALTSLPPNTAYDFYVTQNCGGSVGNSLQSNQGNFRTNPNPPVNDDCAGAINVPIQYGSCIAQTVGDNTAATNSAGVPAPTCANYLGKDIWFMVTVPASGAVTIQTVTPTAGSNVVDTGLSVYSGTCGSLVEVDCDDDGSGTGNLSLLDLTGRTPGEVLYIRVWEYGGDIGDLIAVCVTSPSNCAVPLAPAAGNLSNTTADLSWTRGGTPNPGDTFEIEYGPQGFTPGTGTAFTGLTSPSYQLTGLTANTQYCYYVRQNCGTANGSSAFVGPTCFTTLLTAPANDNPCGAILLTSRGPVTASNVGATTSAQSGITTPVCSPAVSPLDVWFAITPASASTTLNMTGTAAGMVRVYSSPSCSAGPFTLVACQSSGSVTTGLSTMTATGLTPGQRYYVAVSGYGGASPTGSFTIAGTALATKAQAESKALLVYPNPSNTGQLTLRLSNPGKGEATLLNALGQQVRTQALSSSTAEQTISTRGLATGVYTLRVQIGDDVLTRKVVVE
jgi:hypothetical protein